MSASDAGIAAKTSASAEASKVKMGSLNS